MGHEIKEVQHAVKHANRWVDSVAEMLSRADVGPLQISQALVCLRNAAESLDRADCMIDEMQPARMERLVDLREGSWYVHDRFPTRLCHVRYWQGDYYGYFYRHDDEGNLMLGSMVGLMDSDVPHMTLVP